MCGGSKKEAKQQCCITFDDEGQCFGIVICERQCGCFPCKICAKDDDRVMKIAWSRALLDTILLYIVRMHTLPLAESFNDDNSAILGRNVGGIVWHRCYGSRHYSIWIAKYLGAQHWP